MAIFKKKKNGDYFIEMVQSLSEIKADSKNLKEGFKEHVDSEYEHRKLDREWQKQIDIKLAQAIKCPRNDDIDTLMEDKATSEGRFLGIKGVYAVAIGIAGLTSTTLIILWRLGLL